MITMMTFRFSIPGDATAAVKGEGGGTLLLLQRRIGYTALTIGGAPKDAKRMVTVTVTSAIIGKNTRQAVGRLVSPAKSSAWSVYNKTLLLTYDNKYGATTPRDPVEAAKVKRTRYLADARARARVDETESDTDGSAVKIVTPNWYKNKTVVKRDESPMPPGLWNLAHNMEGENGLPVDLEARRKRR